MSGLLLYDVVLFCFVCPLLFDTVRVFCIVYLPLYDAVVMFCISCLYTFVMLSVYLIVIYWGTTDEI